LLRPLIERAVPKGMRVIDSAESAAEAAVKQFGAGIAGTGATGGWAGAEGLAEDIALRCFATDSVEKFERLGSRFLDRPVGKVELVDLGG
jgi:glutamate racemase